MLSEKQSTRRSPMRPIEVSYVSKDAATGSVNDYQFNFPTRWTSDQSTNKVIGMRRLKYTPWSGSIGFTVYVYDDSGNVLGSTIVGPLKFTSANTLEECIAEIEDKASFKGDDGTEYECEIYYSGTTLYIAYHTEELYFLSFQFVFNETLHQYTYNLLMLFNQQLTTDNYTTIAKKFATGDSMIFTNVWNRQDLYFHASFSDSTRQIIGCNNDFWEEPSVFYSAALNSNVWTLRFTQDTDTAIIPRHGVLLVQFSLIFNCLRYLD